MESRAKRRLPEDAVGSRTSVASAASESAALTTMTGAAILGVLAGTTEAAREAHRAPVHNAPQQADAPADTAPPQMIEAAPPHEAAPLRSEPAEQPAPPSPDATPAEHSDLAPSNGIFAVAPAAMAELPSSETAELEATASQSVIGSAAVTSSLSSSSGALTLNPSQPLGSALTIVDGFGQQLTQTLDALVADITALTATIQTSLSNLTDLVDLTAATRTITASVEQLSETLTHTTSALADIADATSQSLAGLTNAVTDQVTGSATALLDTLPTALLGGPEAPQVDTVFQTAFAQESATHVETSAVDSHQAVSTDSFLHVGNDLMPFSVEAPNVQLGFMGQSYAEVVDPHDTTFSMLGHGLHG